MMNIVDLNKEISNFIDYEIKYIQRVINDEHNYESNFFAKPYILYGKDYINNIGFREVYGLNGIYIIFMDDNLSLSYNQVWNFNEEIPCKICPNHYEAINLKIGDCLYLGSCTTCSLYSRLNQHLGKKNFNSSLNLDNDNRKMLKDKIKIYAFPVINGYFTCSDIFLRKIEEKLHKIYSPMCGSKRT